jgi:hypothetical protein
MVQFENMYVERDGVEDGVGDTLARAAAVILKISKGL